MKTGFWASSPEFLVQYVRVECENCISNELPGNVDATDQGNHTLRTS